MGSSLEAEVSFQFTSLDMSPDEFAEICIVASVADTPNASVTKTTHNKCGRCWRHLPEVTEDGTLCARCDEVVNG